MRPKFPNEIIFNDIQHYNLSWYIIDFNTMLMVYIK
jgi:hypothetical protein